MRPRSLSVGVDRAEKFTKKFEGVSSDHEVDDSDSDLSEEQQPTDEKEDWSYAEYGRLVEQLRSVLPKNDTKKGDFRLKKVDWERVAFDGYSSARVRDVTCGLYKKVRKYRTLAETLDDMLDVVRKDVVAKKPKAPLSAYNYFVKDKYASIKEKHGLKLSGEMFKKLSEEFTSLSEKKKRKYEMFAQDAKEAYKVELEKFYQKHPEAAAIELKQPGKGQQSASKKSRVKNLARNLNSCKSVTPFHLFCKEKLADSPSLTRKELRAFWDDQGLEKKLKYVRDAYLSQGSKLTKTEKELLDTAHGKPKLVARTVTEYYLKNHAQPDPMISIMEWRRRKAAEFKALPKLRRLELELELRRARANFVVNYQKYIEKLPLRDKRKEIEFLQSYMESMMDKTEKKQYDGSAIPDLTGCAENDITDLPIAESTTNEIRSPKSKNKKKAIDTVLTQNHPVKPLKSILKSPAPVAPAPKRKETDVAELEVTMSPPHKKQKKSKTSKIDSESDSNVKKGKKIAKKEKESDDGEISSQESQNNGTPDRSTIIKEPKRPPKNVLQYYKKFHYSGKADRLKEAFQRLSTNRKNTIEFEMRKAQKKYMANLAMYLDKLPAKEVQNYVAKLKKSTADSADEHESEEQDADGERNVDLCSTKQEPASSSDDEDDNDD